MGKGKETQPKRAFFVPHHERTARRSHSAGSLPRCGDNPEKGAESHEEGTRDRLGRRKIPRMFQNPTDKKQGDGASEEDTPQTPRDADPHFTPLETIDITLKGGVAVKLYLNKLKARGQVQMASGQIRRPREGQRQWGNPQSQAM